MSTEKVVHGYRLIRPLGAGGMGAVYVAEKLATHQLFAVKFMKDDLVTDESHLGRFKREIAALQAIRHPNVVDVFEACLPPPGSGESPFIVMELLHGEGLDHLLKRKPVLPMAMAVDITLQVLDGLAAAHSVGVIHRDMGPSNVFLEPQPGGKFRARILDFGLARPMGEEMAGNLTQEGTLMGKPAYVAPEVFTCQQLDARSDIFAVGIMLYRMVTGRFPYRESRAQMLWVERYSERDETREYPSPRTFNPDIPESLDAVVARAIRRDPDKRYASAREMQQALLAAEADVLDGQETVVIEPPPRPAGETGSSTLVRGSQISLGRPSAPTRWLPIAVALFALTCSSAVALLLLFRGDRGEEQRAPPAPPPVVQVPVAVAPLPPAPSEERRVVHLVVLGAPPGAIVQVGEVALSGDPPEGDVPWADQEVNVVVAAEGFETYRTKVVPDQHKTIRVRMQPIVIAAPDAGAATDAATKEVRMAAAEAERPVRTPASSRRGREGQVDAGAPPTPAITTPARQDVAATREIRVRVPVDAAGRLPVDPFGGARRLPEEAPF